MYLFKRDYPRAFAGAYEPETQTMMKRNTMSFLDSISQQPNRDHTYWKRYYEYMIKTKNEYLVREKGTGSDPYAAQISWQPHALMRSASWTNLIEETNAHNGYYLSWALPNNNADPKITVFILATLVLGNDRPVYAFPVRVTKDGVSYGTPSKNEPGVGSFIRSGRRVTPDGRILYHLGRNGVVMIKNLFPDNIANISLVSSCLNCMTKATHVCGNCKVAAYCSQECQLEDWNSHYCV